MKTNELERAGIGSLGHKRKINLDRRRSVLKTKTKIMCILLKDILNLI